MTPKSFLQSLLDSENPGFVKRRQFFGSSTGWPSTLKVIESLKSLVFKHRNSINIENWNSSILKEVFVDIYTFDFSRRCWLDNIKVVIDKLDLINVGKSNCQLWRPTKGRSSKRKFSQCGKGRPFILQANVGSRSRWVPQNSYALLAFHSLLQNQNRDHCSWDRSQEKKRTRVKEKERIQKIKVWMMENVTDLTQWDVH